MALAEEWNIKTGSLVEKIAQEVIAKQLGLADLLVLVTKSKSFTHARTFPRPKIKFVYFSEKEILVSYDFNHPRPSNLLAPGWAFHLPFQVWNPSDEVSAPNIPMRMGFSYIPNGVIMEQLAPQGIWN